ncbi:MAG: pectinesterase family protein, partial [Verrucomicrobiota bacterium]
GKLTGTFNPVVTLASGSINGSMTIDTSVAGQVNLILVPQVRINCQPISLFVSTNDTACFNVCATGSEPLGYQWYFASGGNPVPAVGGIPASLDGGSNFVPIDGATNSTYCITNCDGSNNGQYYCVVSNSYNSVTSSIATLTVGYQCPFINGLSDQTVIQGSNVTFNSNIVLANPYPTLQWQTNFVNVDGATNLSLTLYNVQYNALNNATISLIASNAACIVTNSATLTVIVPPSTCPLPTNTTVNVGDTAVFHACPTGIPGPGLQWYKKAVGSTGIGVAIPGQTNDTLTINNAQGSDVAIYSIVAANAAGAVTNSGKLTVNSTTLASTTLSPTGNTVCYDTPLYIAFNGSVYVVNSGKVRIYDATNSVTPVDVIDMSSNTVIISTLNTGIYLTNNVQPHSLFSGDSQVMNYFPVITTGSTAAIYPHSGVMTSNHTYYVTMDNGIVVDSSMAYFAGISDTNAWRFTTKATGAANPTNIVVAADGSGDFVTVQGAVDSVPPGNTSYTVINVKNGTYTEIVDISGKNNITFRGQSRSGTVIAYQNNNNLTGTTAGRASFKVNSANIVIENLTLQNTTPQGGSQAETLLVYNSGTQCIVNNCDIVSRQDTILINAATSQAYFYNCKVTGNFDYIWGIGVGYFDHCVIHTITNIYSGSYNLTAARTATASSYSTNTPWLDPNGTTYSADGFTFVHCILEADPGVTGISLAGSNGTAGGLDAWIYCCIDTNAYVCPASGLLTSYNFWQCTNYDITCSNIITFPCLQTIGVTNTDPRLLAATSPTIWFYGWTPQSAPNIISQPAGATVSAGLSANFIVEATGIPDPDYQWYKNGQSIAGAMTSDYSIASAMRSDAGDYTVAVSNGSGSVTSVVATLTYTGNVAPVANPSAYSRPAGYPLNIPITGNLATNWSDADGDPIALTGVISSTNAAAVSYDSSHVYYTNANDVADQINYTVGDGQAATPGIINVVVGPPPTNSIAGTAVNGNGSVTLRFVGVPGYTYLVEATLDLAPPVVWTPVSTNTAGSIDGTWQFTDTDATNHTQRFYRSLYMP